MADQEKPQTESEGSKVQQNPTQTEQKSGSGGIVKK